VFFDHSNVCSRPFFRMTLNKSGRLSSSDKRSLHGFLERTTDSMDSVSTAATHSLSVSQNIYRCLRIRTDKCFFIIGKDTGHAPKTVPAALFSPLHSVTIKNSEVSSKCSFGSLTILPFGRIYSFDTSDFRFAILSGNAVSKNSEKQSLAVSASNCLCGICSIAQIRSLDAATLEKI